MKNNILYILERPYNTNDRSVITTIERFNQTDNLIVLSRGNKINKGYKHLTFTPQIFSFLSGYLRMIFEVHYSPWVFFKILSSVIIYKPKIIYIREPYYLKYVLYIKRLFPSICITLDVRENPETHYYKQVRILKKHANSIDKCITISDELAIFLKQNYNIKKIDVIYTLPGINYIKNRNVHFDMDDNIVKFCFFGNIIRNRGIHLFANALKSFKHNKNIIFDIYGNVGDKKYLDEILDNGVGFIHYKGVLKYEIASKTLSKYHVGVLTNEINENSKITIPGKLWEYISCGIAVISNKRPSIENRIKQNDIGWVVSNESEWEECISHILSNPKLLKKKREKALKYFDENYECQSKKEIFV